jgi:hypothetical protein
MEPVIRVTTPVEALVESYEYRLDTMAEEFEALLKEQSTENAVLRHEILHMQRQMRLRSAERDFAEKQLDRIRRALA